MAEWICSFLFSAMEVMGSFYFLDTFLEKKERQGIWCCRFFFYFAATYAAAVSGAWLSLFKCVPIILAYAVLNRFYYHVSFKQNLFFSSINYVIIVLVDYIILCIWLIIFPDRGQAVVGKEYLPALLAKTLWIIILLLIRKCCGKKTDYRLLTWTEWLRFGSIPLFTMTALLMMYFSEQDTERVNGIFLFLSEGLVAVNFIVLSLMGDILEKEEKVRIGILTEQSQKKRLDAYHDREEIYDRQKKKMHDYKNQLSTIQTLLQGKQVNAALTFTQKLTESISVDMSAINTNHSVINAVLNQKYRTMQEKNIAVILKLGDLHEVAMEEEEIVILLSNLLDNAIRESERVLKERGKAVVQIKLVYENGKMILAVRNPVMEKVEIINDMVQIKRGECQGIGLLNVKAVVNKYEGEMVLTCDDNAFKAVVIL